jgi:uncharacterized cupredoxin-like copper-binding protein
VIRSAPILAASLAAVVLVAVAMVAVGLTAATARGPQTVEIGIRFSAFSPASVAVRAGAPVTFVIRNDDPIDHEWIIGDEALHTRHRTGREPVHDRRPTEVTVEALTTERTTVVFDRPGVYRFICHLPGHEAYGMTGIVNVSG